jgi:preprotein translocase subunit SecA
MSASASNELWAVFDARRVKAPEMKGLDSVANGAVGWFKNRRRMLARYKKQAARIEGMEKEVHELGATRFAEEVQKCRDLARRNRLEGADLERGLALVREGALRAVGMRPSTGTSPRWRPVRVRR